MAGRLCDPAVAVARESGGEEGGHTTGRCFCEGPIEGAQEARHCGFARDGGRGGCGEGHGVEPMGALGDEDQQPDNGG